MENLLYKVGPDIKLKMLYIFIRSLEIVQYEIIVVYTLYLLCGISIWHFLSAWAVPVFLLQYCKITQRICCLLLNVLSVICRLHSLRHIFKILFNLKVVFSLRAHAFFYLGPYAANHGITLTSHIGGFIITAVLAHMHMIVSSKCYHDCLSRC
jgi:hypothetical protein